MCHENKGIPTSFLIGTYLPVCVDSQSFLQIEMSDPDDPTQRPCLKLMQLFSITF